MTSSLRPRRTLGLAGVVALVAALFTATAPAASADSGYTLFRGSITRDYPSYTIKLASTGFNAPTRDLFQRAINQIHGSTNTRLTLAAGQYPTGTQPGTREIVVYLAAPGESCGGQTTWDGCGGPTSYTRTGGLDFVRTSKIRLKANVFTHVIETQRSIVAHELGHALGMDHHGSTAVLMHPTVNRYDAGTYKAGDFAGLRHLAQNTAAPGGKVVTAVAAPGLYINARQSATTSSSVVRQYLHGTRLTIVCHVRGQQLSGGPYNVTTTIWNRVDVGGYIWDGNLATGSDNPVVPAC